MRARLCFCLSLCILAVLSLPACSKPVEPSIEEKIMSGMFADFVLATAYDNICKDGSIAKADDKDSARLHYYGNAQIMGARMAMLWKLRHPKGNPQEGVNELLSTQEKFSTALTQDLKDQGCTSDTGRVGAAAFALYTGTHPSAMMVMIDENIRKAGGTVSTPDILSK